MYISIKSFKEYKADEFSADISKVPWSVVDVLDDVEDKLNAFNILFHNILENMHQLRHSKYVGDQICV